MKLVQFICKKLWAWHTCPADMRKDYKAITLEWLGMAVSALTMVAGIFGMLILHNAML